MTQREPTTGSITSARVALGLSYETGASVSKTKLLFSLLHHSLVVRNLFEMLSGVKKKEEKFPTSSLNTPLHL